MTVRNLTSLFAPKSVVLIGASAKPNSVGFVLAKNLQEGGFEGPLFFVNPHAEEILGLPVYKTVDALPEVAELAIIATPPASIPDLIASLGAAGTKAAIVISAGFSEIGAEGQALQQKMLEAASLHTLRIVGPNCIGLLSPHTGLNASFAHRAANKGKTAFISQSGAMLTSVLDWASSRGIGFSSLVSLGAMSDVDFGDMLDYLATDQETKSVLLYIESITNARKFMSAARRCARLKPVIVIKSGRHPEGAAAARSHTGALAGSDAVADAAFRRAGLSRVQTVDDLFDALEALSSAQTIGGERLAILTNGGGVGVLATDYLIDEGGTLARLSSETLERLNQSLPNTWSKANPVDIIGDARDERYSIATKALLADPNSDALLVLNCPVAVATSTSAATAVCAEVKAARDNGNSKPVFTAWLGDSAVKDARAVLDAGGLPVYPTPEKAVRAFMHQVRRRKSQELLMQVPASTEGQDDFDRQQARNKVKAALETGREWLTPMEANDVLRAYAVPVVEMRVATTPEEASRVASGLGFPVALKVLSSDIVHKSDVGAVVLNLRDAQSVARAAATMQLRIAEVQPEAQIDGFIVQPMASRPGAHELIIGLSEDPLFGPVIMFGQGGTSVEVVKDQALALPPLNTILAKDLISRTRVSRLLAGYRDRPRANIEAIVNTIIAVQAMAIDMPEIKELDINPLWVNEQGVLALDARIRVKTEPRAGTARFAIKPYPHALIKQITDRNGKSFLMRPIRPEDVSALQAAIADTDPSDVRMRFFSSLRQLPERLAVRLTQIDYDREMAFVIIEEATGIGAGVVRLSLDPDRTRGEYAIIVKRDRQGTGLGFRMMQEIIAYARSIGVRQIFGDVLHENTSMLAMAEELGFKRTSTPEPGVSEITLVL